VSDASLAPDPGRARAAERFMRLLRRVRALWQGTPPGRTATLAAAALVGVFVFLHVAADDADAQRYTAVLARLAGVKLIDARWDIAVLRSRSMPSTERVVQSRDVVRIQRALDDAFDNAHSNALRASIDELRRAYDEKSDLVTRYRQAAADASYALTAAMRADAAVGTLVRNAWRDFPQRERLVAAENLVARVLAEAQQYHHSPSAASRAALENAAVDLPRAHSLPRAVESALERLDSDVNQVLLLKPLEQMLGKRLDVLNTSARVDALAETFQRQLDDALVTRSRYRTALALYSAVLLAIAVVAMRRFYRRYTVLEALAARSAPRSDAAVEDAELVDVRPADERHPGDAANIRVMRRP
jgi:hypothetical protein